MRIKLLLAALIVGALSGCVVRENHHGSGGGNGGNGGGGSPGDVTFLWSFTDGTGCGNSGTNLIHIEIPGETLDSNGFFDCTDPNGDQGIQLTDFAPGSYTFTITALDSNNTPLYRGSGSFDVDGDVSVNVPLDPLQVAATTATLQLGWSFLDGSGRPMGCTQAHVSQVQVTLDGTAPFNVPCTANGADGAEFDNLAVGAHQVTVDAFDDAQGEYLFDQSVTVNAPSTSANVQLEPLDGSWDLAYNFANAPDCNAAGIDKVSLSVIDSGGHEISGTQGMRYDCQEPGSMAQFAYDSFAAGDVTVQLDGYDLSGNLVRGAHVQTTLHAGSANSNTVTLQVCGDSASGC